MMRLLRWCGLALSHAAWVSRRGEFRPVAAKRTWRAATVRHLLTHAAGVREWLHPSPMINSGWFAETFPIDQRCPPSRSVSGLPAACSRTEHDRDLHRPRIAQLFFNALVA